jgi:hypothetical protein
MEHNSSRFPTAGRFHRPTLRWVWQNLTESMLMHTRYVLIILTATLPLLPAAAHHSTAFYSSEFIELEGTFARIDWINPHVRFVLRTMEPNGAEKLWTMEASATSALQRRGVSRELFRVGDRVKVAGHPSTRNDARVAGHERASTRWPRGVVVARLGAALRQFGRRDDP